MSTTTQTTNIINPVYTRSFLADLSKHAIDRLAHMEGYTGKGTNDEKFNFLLNIANQ